MYERGDLPLRVSGGTHRYVHWHVGGAMAKQGNKLQATFAGSAEYDEAKVRFLAQLDYSVWLPLMFDGLREQKDPCRFLATTAVKDLLTHGRYEQVAPVVPLLVVPIRSALNTREPATVPTPYSS